MSSAPGPSQLFVLRRGKFLLYALWCSCSCWRYGLACNPGLPGQPGSLEQRPHQAGHVDEARRQGTAAGHLKHVLHEWPASSFHPTTRSEICTAQENAVESCLALVRHLGPCTPNLPATMEHLAHICPFVLPCSVAANLRIRSLTKTGFTLDKGQVVLLDTPHPLTVLVLPTKHPPVCKALLHVDQDRAGSDRGA